MIPPQSDESNLFIGPADPYADALERELCRVTLENVRNLATGHLVAAELVALRNAHETLERAHAALSADAPAATDVAPTAATDMHAGNVNGEG